MRYGAATEDNNDKAPSALSSHICNTETHLSRKQLRKRPAEFMKGKFTLTSNPRISNKAEIGHRFSPVGPPPDPTKMKRHANSQVWHRYEQGDT